MKVFQELKNLNVIIHIDLFFIGTKELKTDMHVLYILPQNKRGTK